MRCLAYIENGRQKNFWDFYSPEAVFEMRAIVAKLLGIFGEFWKYFFLNFLYNFLYYFIGNPFKCDVEGERRAYNGDWNEIDMRPKSLNVSRRNIR